MQSAVRRQSFVRLFVPTVILPFAFSACTLPTDAPDSNAETLSAQGPRISPQKQACYDPLDPTCLPGPAPDDPNPSAPGYYIGSDYTMSFCRQSNDLDFDGFDDNCERRLASRFSPLLATKLSDDTSRETYWVATYRDQLPGLAPPGESLPEGVDIMYLIGYHLDLGDSVIGVFVDGGHSGDSEFVVLRVGYNASTKHWILWNAFYAAHHETSTESDFQGPYPDFEYPDVYRGYPRVWAADKKHGSYISKVACNRGGLEGSDDCSYNRDRDRLEILWNRNLGTGSHQFKNCVSSTNPISYPGTECFWDYLAFCGWDLDRTNCSTAYRSWLNEFGFYAPFV